MSTRSPAGAAHNGAHLVLVVDDDDDVAALVSRFLGSQGGLRTVHARDAGTARDCVARLAPDLVLLDLGLPDEDGLGLLRQLEHGGGPPVIVISGRGAASERVVGLDLGAHDYIAKPFDLHELLARVRGVLRRNALPGPPSPRVLEFDGFALDRTARALRSRTGDAVPLTSGEFGLLCAFVDHPHEVLSRDALMSALHGRDAGPFDRSIDVAVGRLRRKLEAAAARPGLLQAVRGAGYVLATDVVRR